MRCRRPSTETRFVAEWNPATYRRFASERFLPFEDLVALVRVRPNLRVVDLGCGTGELTAQLAERLTGADVSGLDSSAQMLAQAQAYARPHLRFSQTAIEDVDGRFDLIFSNAALQWIDDHASLFPRLYAMLEPEGQLVVQLPAQRRPVAYECILDVARREPHRSALDGFEQHWPVLPIESYAEMLHAAGARDVTALDKVYLHVLEDADALADWQAGTALIPYRERLEPEEFRAFDADLRTLLRRHWPEQPVTFAFRRTIVAATRPG